jgi:hypothetical protein
MLKAFARFIGACIVLPPLMGFLGFGVGVLLANLVQGDAEQMSVVFGTSIVFAGATLLAGLIYVVAKGTR